MRKRVLIYCVSGYDERIAYQLDDMEYEIVGVVDKNPEFWGKKLRGIGRVIPPREIVGGVDFDLVIIGIAEHEARIRTELETIHKIPSEKIAVYMPQTHGIKWQDERIVAFRKCVAMLKERNIQGDMAEVGVYKGDFAKLFNRYFPEQKLYLFDTFEGFDSSRDDVCNCDLNKFKDTSENIVLEKMCNPDNVIICKGYFPDTARNIEGKFSFVSLDCDLYNPIKAGLEFFYPRLVAGGYIFVHDFGSYHYETVKDAVYDYVTKTKAVMFPLTDRGQSVIISK